MSKMNLDETDHWLGSLPQAELCRVELDRARRVQLDRSTEYVSDTHGVKMHTTPSQFANETIEAIGDCAILLSMLIHGSTVAPPALGHDDSGRVHLKPMSRAHNFASVEQGLATTRETIANLLCEQPIRYMQPSSKAQLADLLYHLRSLELEHQSAPLLWASDSLHDVLRHLWVEKLSEHSPPEIVDDVSCHVWTVWLYGFRKLPGAHRALGAGPSAWTTSSEAEVGRIQEGLFTINRHATVGSFECLLCLAWNACCVWPAAVSCPRQ
jgi:hypothetical protein